MSEDAAAIYVMDGVLVSIEAALPSPAVFLSDLLEEPLERASV